MIPVAVDLPPPFFPVACEEQFLEFDPYEIDGYFRSVPEQSHSAYGLEGTTNTPSRAAKTARSLRSFWQTSSSALDRTLELAAADTIQEMDVPGQLAELKRLTGVSWDNLAGLLGCTRQALHRWSLGGAISGGNRDHLAKLHATVKFIDRGNAEENRALLDTAYGGMTFSELLSQGHFEDVRAAAGPGPGRSDAGWRMVDRLPVPSGDHWYDRLVASAYSSDDVVVRAKPQKFKRLRLKKG